MSETRVINIRSGECYDAVGRWCDGYVYIGRRNVAWKMRESRYANPFKIRDFQNPQDCLNAYREHIEKQLNNPYQPVRDQYRYWFSQLKGQTLVCWCKNKGDEPCHGDVLVELIEKYFPSKGEENL